MLCVPAEWTVCVWYMAKTALVKATRRTAAIVKPGSARAASVRAGRRVCSVETRLPRTRSSWTALFWRDRSDIFGRSFSSFFAFVSATTGRPPSFAAAFADRTAGCKEELTAAGTAAAFFLCTTGAEVTFCGFAGNDASRARFRFCDDWRVDGREKAAVAGTACGCGKGRAVFLAAIGVVVSTGSGVATRVFCCGSARPRVAAASCTVSAPICARR